MTNSLASTLQQLKQDPDFVNLSALPFIQIELKYATLDNFMTKNVYGVFNEAFLHRLAAQKLKHAIELLQQTHPGFKLVVYDALRPRSVQKLLWAHVEGTPNEPYVANPARGSMHNYGCAIDLTIADASGTPLNMGTAFDAFEALSQPQLEAEHLRQGKLQQQHIDHRMILRRCMTGAGFLQLPHEWWHFDAFPQAEVRQSFRLIE